MFRILFHISIFPQGLIPLIMVHIPAIGDLGLAALYVRVPLTFRM